MLVLFMNITRLASNEIFSPSNKIHWEVGRAEDLSGPRYVRILSFQVFNSTAVRPQQVDPQISRPHHHSLTPSNFTTTGHYTYDNRLRFLTTGLSRNYMKCSYRGQSIHILTNILPDYFFYRVYDVSNAQLWLWQVRDFSLDYFWLYSTPFQNSLYSLIMA